MIDSLLVWLWSDLFLIVYPDEDLYINYIDSAMIFNKLAV